MDLFAQLAAAAQATRRKHGPLRAEDLETRIVTAVVELVDADKFSLASTRLIIFAAMVLSVCSVLFAAATAFGVVPPFSSGPLRWVVAGVALVLAVVWLVLAVSVAETKIFRVVSSRSIAPTTIHMRERVGIEPAETYKNFKVIADDLGMMYLDEPNRRLLVDGTRHRISLCGEDVRSTALGAVKLGSGVQIQFEIDGTPLDIVISARGGVPATPDEPLDQRKRLAQRIRTTLGLENEEE
jgi:hypothetical protein